MQRAATAAAQSHLQRRSAAQLFAAIRHRVGTEPILEAAPIDSLIFPWHDQGHIRRALIGLPLLRARKPLLRLAAVKTALRHFGGPSGKLLAKV